jgi:hypothetical protein
MTETVWLSMAPGKTELTSFYQMEDRAAPPLDRTKNMIANGGGGTWTPSSYHRGRSMSATARKSLDTYSQ